MMWTRRAFSRAGLAGLAAVGPTFTQAATTSTVNWPTGPVRLIMPFPPGGGTDAGARMMADRLGKMWNVPVVVDNKPGANTLIGTEALLAAPRDGNTFLVTIGLTLQLPYLLRKVAFNPLQDLVPVGAMSVQQLVLVANPASGIKTIADIPKAAAAGRKLAFGSYGTGSTSHFMQIEMSKATKSDILHVPYKGSGAAIVATMSGEVTFTLANLGTVRQQMEAGKLVAVGVTGDKRSRFVPEVPTLSEQGIKSFDSPLWIGIFVARGVPDPIVRKLSADTLVALQSPELSARLLADGQEPGRMSMEEFRAMTVRDTAAAERIIKSAGVRLE